MTERPNELNKNEIVSHLIPFIIDGVTVTVEKALEIKQKIEQEGGYPIFDLNSYSFIVEESPLFLRS